MGLKRTWLEPRVENSFEKMILENTKSFQKEERKRENKNCFFERQSGWKTQIWGTVELEDLDDFKQTS